MAATLSSRMEIARRAAPTLRDDQLVRSVAAGILDDLGVTEPPVDVEMVASYLGIDGIVVDDDLPASGCLRQRDDGRFEIRVLGADPVTRQRFTIGHECAHTFFPGYATRSRYRCAPVERTDDRRDVEALCDLAASEILLPSRLFGRDALAGAFGFAGLERLAQRYEASLEATARRYVDARPEPTALLLLSVRHRPSDRRNLQPPRLRVDYAHCKGEWPYFLPSKSVTTGDPLDRAAGGEDISERCTFSGICDRPVTVDIEARYCPIVVDGEERRRVVALLRRVEDRR
ncbi:MAG TPA: ImmA/IrrE family metallo-endopeptidase [Acidimicrobiales bacterium]